MLDVTKAGGEGDWKKKTRDEAVKKLRAAPLP